MSKKTIGYMELEWTCANCGTKNPGMAKTCKACGSPQPENVQFGIGEQKEIITDAQKIAGAKKGADIHCPFCGTRNPADAQTCSQCGGDLTGGARRVSGTVIGGAANPPQAGQNVASTVAGNVKASKFRPWMLLPVGAVLLICCAVVGFLFLSTAKASATVQSVSWERVIPIEALRNVTREDWRDEVPQDAKILGCDEKYRSRQDNPAPNAIEVCNTELVDNGNGAAEVVETCYYEVYDDYCEYTAQEWQQVDKAVAQGSDLQPYWPVAQVSAGEREGEPQGTYIVQFQTDKGIKEYTTDENSFSQFQLGSKWTLEINPLGAIVSVSPQP
jgi:predicted nucleic acid-binding Zn ribbon protein